MIPKPTSEKLYLDHIVLTVSDLERTPDFYIRIFGEPLQTDRYSVMYQFGETKFFLVLSYGELPADDRFNPNRIGLEHLAFGVRELKDLQTIEKALTQQGVRHSGIHIDRHSQREKMWLDDPDGIRLVFFLRPSQRSNSI